MLEMSSQMCRTFCINTFRLATCCEHMSTNILHFAENARRTSHVARTCEHTCNRLSANVHKLETVARKCAPECRLLRANAYCCVQMYSKMQTVARKCSATCAKCTQTNHMLCANVNTSAIVSSADVHKQANCCTQMCTTMQTCARNCAQACILLRANVHQHTSF